MSYTTNFVHAQPIAKTQPAKTNTVESKQKAAARKDSTTKILLFVAIIACVALAVSI